MTRKRPPTSRRAQARVERERAAGLDPDDEAAHWLTEHDPEPPPSTPKAAQKSKLLHQWRRRQSEEDSRP